MREFEHWQSVYQQKAAESVSWFQAQATVSHEFVRAVAPGLDARILDVGGGASTLVDSLVDDGYGAIAVLDIAPAALTVAQTRLGARASAVSWLAADVLAVPLQDASVDVWHDRAVFHFLVTPESQAAYVAQVRRVLRPGGHAIVATFAEDGPVRCSGLKVARYSADELHGVFGSGFRLLSSQRDAHVTPAGVVQPFTFCVCRWDPQERGLTSA
jgi:ubiquinone/menaquinone biosynthesis C-methylase UbiE